MSAYFTRLRVRRVHRWRGEPLNYNRKLKTLEYSSLEISTDDPLCSTVISTGQNILIKSEHENYPYVAQVLKLFEDESRTQKKALVQWFTRVSEVPPAKLNLLGRDPHPMEVFLYKGGGCDEEVDAESILRPVQVKQLSLADPFPDPTAPDIFYVKLSWDRKTFKALESSAHPLPTPSLPPSPPSSPPAAAPATRGPSRHALPTPDPAVLRWAASEGLRCIRSAGKIAAEAESLHSATKMSASKCLSARRRRNATAGQTGVRKKLELASPDGKREDEDDLRRLLDEDLEVNATAIRRLPSSPLSCSLSPVRKGPGPRSHAPVLKPAVVLRRVSSPERGSVPPPNSPQQVPNPTEVQTPRTRRSTPRRGSATRGQHAVNPGNKEAWSSKEPVLAVLAEVDGETSPVLPVAVTPRSSKRKSAQLVSSRIRRQLSLLENQRDIPMSDSNSEDEFVPSKVLQSSSSEEEEEEEEEEEVALSDEEVVTKKSRRTPRAKRITRSSAGTPIKTPRRKVAPATPRTPRHATPCIPSRALPARRPANVLEEARTRLHVSSVPESLPCREQEFQDVYDFVESRIADGTGGCMYISGVPGTGKTATVHEVIRCLQRAADEDEIPPFNFVEINGMKMTDPHQAYIQILQKLTGQKATADHAAALLEKKFSNPAPRKETTVLLVDELDLLWTRKQNVMYNLFDWPTRRHARLVVLTIANTMDLPERIMINRVASRLGLTRMSFQPYGFKQLQQIVASRLDKLKAFENDALQLVARKVAALSGDARRCLDICRRATEICELSAGGLVGMSHVMEALDEMFSSSYITAIRCASLQEQIFLRAVISEFRRLGLEEATFQQVLVQHQALCRVEGVQPASVSEVMAACRRLGACRLLLLESTHRDVLQRVRLNVSQDDVLYALKAD